MRSVPPHVLLAAVALAFLFAADRVGRSPASVSPLGGGGASDGGGAAVAGAGGPGLRAINFGGGAARVSAREGRRKARLERGNRKQAVTAGRARAVSVW